MAGGSTSEKIQRWIEDAEKEERKTAEEATEMDGESEDAVPVVVLVVVPAVVVRATTPGGGRRRDDW